MVQQWRTWINSVYHFFAAIRRIITALLTLEDRMNEIVDTLNTVNTQLVKARVEILGKIADLEARLAEAGNTSAEVTAALAELKSTAQGLDEIVADAAPESPAEPEAPAEPADPEAPADSEPRPIPEAPFQG